jgi:NADPH:quinone reductase-like Zn-dependent oxidoreductase
VASPFYKDLMNATLMKAVVCPRYGAPEVLQLTELPIPKPEFNEVRIRVRATTVTVADTRIRGFNVPGAFWIPARLALGLFKPRKPVLGAELAGDIDAVGEAVRNFQVGDAVYATSLLTMGAYAEYICLPTTAAMERKPTTLTYAEAAAIPIGASTAWHFLNKANIQHGQHIMVYGASGSVGTYAVQLAKYLGAKVTAVCSGKNAALVKSLGADHVVDYTQPNFEKQLGQYDVVFVAIDKIPFSTCNRVLKSAGVYINVTIPLKSPAMIWASLTRSKKIWTGQNTPATASDLQFLNALVEAKQLKVVVDRNFPLVQIVEAHRYVDAGHKKGNVTVTIG